MLEYATVHVDYLFKGCLIGNVNKIGLKINIPKNLKINVDTDIKLYLKLMISSGIKNNLTFEIFGFKDYKDRNFFNELNQINGIGPKTAMSIVEYGIDNIFVLIENGEFEKIRTLLKINIKQCNAIIANLSYKNCVQTNVKNHENINVNLLDQAKATLKVLGYTNQNIETAISRCELQKSDDVSLIINKLIKSLN